MEITHIGHSAFKIRGKSATLVTDPFNAEKLGLKFPEIEADIITVSHQHSDHNDVTRITGNPIVISGPGEYERKGVKIIGLASFHDVVKGAERGKNTIFYIEMDGISIVHLGDLGHKLSDKEREVLNGADILMIPVGGFYTISADIAREVVVQLEPSIIIPMHYQTAKLIPSIAEKLAPVTAFLKEMGKEGVVSVPKLNISKDKIPTEQTVVVLEN
jgi:L-ascorbate metabolism protein UlaG (beta-lactamase superfamily)